MSEERQCRSVNSLNGLRCELMTTHDCEHTAVNVLNGFRCFWSDEAATRDIQVGGEHYRKFKIQPWDIWQEYGLNAFEGAVLKYLLRRKGNRLEDLRKARHTLDRLIEIEEQRDGTT